VPDYSSALTTTHAIQHGSTRLRVLQLFTFLVFLIAGIPAQAQMIGGGEDETKLYAETKQVNQFFRRFNGEENEKGDRYYPKDKQYRSVKLRRQYLDLLFDAGNTGISRDLKNQFIRDILEKKDPVVLDFHGGNWFAEVQASFIFYGKPQPVTLFMELEKDHLGSKWVIHKVYAGMFEQYFTRDTSKVGRFLHPLSHELAFMNLRKAFDNRDSVTQFAVKRFQPDHLSVFLYELQRGNLKFRSVEDVKFHFFQINGWYFELSQFNRPGYNTGWLISNLVKVNNDSEKDQLRKHLYYEK
jgi:hypothetical protein